METPPVPGRGGYPPIMSVSLLRSGKIPHKTPKWGGRQIKEAFNRTIEHNVFDTLSELSSRERERHFTTLRNSASIAHVMRAGSQWNAGILVTWPRLANRRWERGACDLPCHRLTEREKEGSVKDLCVLVWKEEGTDIASIVVEGQQVASLIEKNNGSKSIGRPIDTIDTWENTNIIWILQLGILHYYTRF